MNLVKQKYLTKSLAAIEVLKVQIMEETKRGKPALLLSIVRLVDRRKAGKLQHLNQDF